MIRFLLNQQLIEIHAERADLTVLDYLRERQSLCGTKEGCASGDCGACTVVLVELSSDQQQLEYRSVNSCVTFISSLHNKQLITVEHLAEPEQLHPVQQAMVSAHGSQCGFCTPGFVMSLFAFYHQTGPCNEQNIELALSGNLCRCTGYKPIIEAAEQSCHDRQADSFDANAETTINRLRQLHAHEQQQEQQHQDPFMPTTREQLRAYLSRHPQARLFAGSTDLALETTQQLRDLTHLVDLKYLPELNRMEQQDTGLLIGAAVSLSRMETLLLSHFADVKELLWRFASVPLRNQASLGGNVANASPIGDMPPLLLALEAVIHTDNGQQRRQIPVSEFFIDYRKTALQSDEWISAIFIPYQRPSASLRAYKVSKRFEDDISAVCAVFQLELNADNSVQRLTTGFGGVAAIPSQAAQLAAAVEGQNWHSAATMELGKTVLKQQFTPIDDVRASAQYRVDILCNLWHRFWLQTSQPSIPTRVQVYA